MERKRNIFKFVIEMVCFAIMLLLLVVILLTNHKKDEIPSAMLEKDPLTQLPPESEILNSHKVQWTEEQMVSQLSSVLEVSDLHTVYSNMQANSSFIIPLYSPNNVSSAYIFRLDFANLDCDFGDRGIGKYSISYDSVWDRAFLFQPKEQPEICMVVTTEEELPFEQKDIVESYITQNGLVVCSVKDDYENQYLYGLLPFSFDGENSYIVLSCYCMNVQAKLNEAKYLFDAINLYYIKPLYTSEDFENGIARVVVANNYILELYTDNGFSDKAIYDAFCFKFESNDNEEVEYVVFNDFEENESEQSHIIAEDIGYDSALAKESNIYRGICSIDKEKKVAYYTQIYGDLSKKEQNKYKNALTVKFVGILGNDEQYTKYYKSGVVY